MRRGDGGRADGGGGGVLLAWLAWKQTAEQRRRAVSSRPGAVAMLPPGILHTAPGELGPPIFEQGACRIWFGSMHAWNVQAACRISSPLRNNDDRHKVEGPYPMFEISPVLRPARSEVSPSRFQAETMRYSFRKHPYIPEMYADSKQIGATPIDHVLMLEVHSARTCADRVL